MSTYTNLNSKGAKAMTDRTKIWIGNVAVEVEGIIGTKKFTGMHMVPTEMLVWPRVADLAPGLELQSVEKEIDRCFGGQLSQALSNFTGKINERLVLKADPQLHPEAKQRYILVVGIGDIFNFNGRAACQVFDLIMRTADELQVERLTIPFIPNSVTQLNMGGTSNTLQQVVNRMVQRQQLSKLKRIDIVCSFQARRIVVSNFSDTQSEGKYCCPDME
jgi:hypothetical protein